MRALRVCLEADVSTRSDVNIQLRVYEQFRHNVPRQILVFDCGASVDDDTHDLILQVFEDTYRSIYRRTIGQQGKLDF